MEIRQARRSDYPQILQLQSANIPEHLTTEQRQQGFIVSKMDEKQLEAINNELGIIVACDDKKITGFVCLNRSDHRPRPGIVDAMLAELPHTQLDGQSLNDLRIFLYGPVCIDQLYRGKGLLRQLFHAARLQTKGQFDAGVAFVNDSNPHSLSAHVQGLGMQDVLSFCYQGEHYHLLAFLTDQP